MPENFKMKSLILTVIFMVTCTFMYAETVELNGNLIKIDGKDVLKFEKNKIASFSIYTIDGEELLMYRLHDNETPGDGNDDYYVLNFILEKKKIEAIPAANTTGIGGMNVKKTSEKVVNWLLREKVLNADGTLNADRIDIFISKYDENIRDRTFRIR